MFFFYYHSDKSVVFTRTVPSRDSQSFDVPASVAPDLSLDTSKAPSVTPTVANPASVMSSSSSRDNSPSGKTIFSEFRIFCQISSTLSVFPMLCGTN